MVIEVEAPECSCEGAEAHESYPTFTVIWGDGSQEDLPGICVENDMSAQSLGDIHEEIVTGGMHHPDSFPGSFTGVFLWKIREGLYLRSEGDVDEDMRSSYLRGDLAEVLDHFFSTTEMNYVPIRELLLAKSFGLLDDVELDEGAYPVALFNRDEEFAGLLFNLELSVDESVSAPLFTSWLEAAPWLTRVRDGLEPESSMWHARIAEYQE